MLVTIYEKDSGASLRVEAIDAKECVAGGFYVKEPPKNDPAPSPIEGLAPLPVIGGRRKAKSRVE